MKKRKEEVEEMARQKNMKIRKVARGGRVNWRRRVRAIENTNESNEKKNRSENEMA